MVDDCCMGFSGKCEKGQNGTIALFIEIYINLLVFWKYIGIFHFLGTRVWGTRVFHGTTFWVLEFVTMSQVKRFGLDHVSQTLNI